VCADEECHLLGGGRAVVPVVHPQGKAKQRGQNKGKQEARTSVGAFSMQVVKTEEDCGVGEVGASKRAKKAKALSCLKTATHEDIHTSLMSAVCACASALIRCILPLFAALCTCV
jgi:hypothetical protein